jgi:hypothetical protein
MQYKRAIRNPGLLLALVLLTGFGVFTSTATGAEESMFSDAKLFSNGVLDDLLDGDVRMAGDQRNGLHLSSRSETEAARYVSRHSENAASGAGVHLSWKLAW